MNYIYSVPHRSRIFCIIFQQPPNVTICLCGVHQLHVGREWIGTESPCQIDSGGGGGLCQDVRIYAEAGIAERIFASQVVASKGLIITRAKLASFGTVFACSLSG